VNWKKIVTHGIAVSLVQLTAGIAEGYFYPQPGTLFSVFSAVSFIACVGIFGHLGAHQMHRPLAHAFLALVLYASVSLMVGVALSRLLGSVPVVLIALEWLSLVVAAVSGVAAGKLFGRGAAMSHEA
jgi:hypothetical protein